MRKRLFICNLLKQGTVKHSLSIQIVTTDNWFQGVSFVILDCTAFYEMRFCFAKRVRGKRLMRNTYFSSLI